MKKNTLLIILGLITILCIIFGSVKHIGGGIKALREWGISEYDDWDDSDKNDSESKSSFNQTLEAFSEIKMNTGIAEVKIEEGNQYQIECNFSKSWLKPSFSVKNGTLEISQQRKKGPTLGGNHVCRITLKVPSGTKLDKININSNVGDLKLRDISAEKIDLNLNVGEVTVRRVDFTKLDVNNNVGEISIEPVDDIANYDISIETDVGDVSVDGRSYKRNYASKGNGNKKIKAQTNVGEVRIN